jgi:DNA (cytosine-5)-methyltransferase 1
MPDKGNLQAVIEQRVVGALCSRDYKGVGSQYVEEGKVVVESRHPIAIPIQDGREMNKHQNGLGVGQDGDPAYTLDTTGAQAVFTNEKRDETIAIPFRKSKRARSDSDDETWISASQANTLNQFDSGERDTHAIATSHAFYSTDGTHGVNQTPEVSPPLKVGSSIGIPSPPAVAQGVNVRRLTPRECERLQGFPDDWTQIGTHEKPTADSHRYKQLGNAVTVNVAEWIARRIKQSLEGGSR